ncbi:hypothetical protein [Streptomyces sp. NPDC089919]|uniref:hypothetical protein n=1 Tax=Streptomyces sp. NPDC089919 TaxID=3155188 RepID=UPI003439225A
MTGRRFVGARDLRQDLPRWMLVVCPRCAGTARVVPLGRVRRVVCGECGLTRESARPRRAVVGAGPCDPYFGLPLRLRVRTRHGWLWAYDPEHLDLIGDFVAAAPADRAALYGSVDRHALLTGLPPWIKRAAHRADVLAAVGRIRGLSDPTASVAS